MWHDRKWYSRLAAVARWLHVYLSMLGFAALLLFSMTGLTLNHPEWFSGEHRRVLKGQIPLIWLSGPATDLDSEAARDTAELPRRLEIVEHLRREHSIGGAVAEFVVDEEECLVAFKGPGYAADVFIDRETGDYEATETRHGTVAVLNDLHKGRHTGGVWSWIIDLSAVVMTLASLTGFLLLFFIRRRRRSGLWVALAGAVAVAFVAWLLTP